MHLTLPVFLILSSVLVPALGEACQNPVVNQNTYTTADGMVVSELALIMEFTVSCSPKVKALSLYADVKGKTFPAAKSLEKSSYQVSWTEDPAQLFGGIDNIKIYDEDGFAALRKAQRHGTSSEGINSIFSVPAYQGGIYYGPVVQSEFLASIFSVLLWYIAFLSRSKLVA